MWPFWDSDGGPGWSGMVDMPILDRYKISGRKRLVDGFIFGGDFSLILVTRWETLGKVVIWDVCIAIFGLKWGP